MAIHGKIYLMLFKSQNFQILTAFAVCINWVLIQLWQVILGPVQCDVVIAFSSSNLADPRAIPAPPVDDKRGDSFVEEKYRGRSVDPTHFGFQVPEMYNVILYNDFILKILSYGLHIISFPTFSFLFISFIFRHMIVFV